MHELALLSVHQDDNTAYQRHQILTMDKTFLSDRKFGNIHLYSRPWRTVSPISGPRNERWLSQRWGGVLSRCDQRVDRAHGAHCMHVVYHSPYL